MRIDNNTLDSNRSMDPKEVAFCRKIEAILIKELDMEYADVIHAYRQVEEEFVNDADYDEWWILETKRRIAERILHAAHGSEQPFEVCRDNWNALFELGFSSIERFCTMAWFYADSCLFNAQYDAGLDVIDMVVREIHRRLEEPGLTRQAEKYYDRELTTLGELRKGLVAHKSSEAEGIAWDERQEAESEAKHAEQPSPRMRQENELVCNLSAALSRVRKTSTDRSFAEMVHAYRKAEADFLAQLEMGDEFFIPQVHRHVAYAILDEAQKHHEAFEVCRDAWNELLRCGFGELTDKCALTRIYAECCSYHRQPDAGLAVVEPLLAEIQKHVDEGTDIDIPLRFYREIARLTKLRDKLKAIAR